MTVRRMISFILVVVSLVCMVCISPVSAGAAENTSDALTEEYDYGVFTYEMYTEDSVIITDFRCFSKAKLIVPSVLGGYPVKAIGENAFEDMWPEEIVLPETLESIGDNAFCDAEIKSLKIPASVSEIGINISNESNLVAFSVASGNKYYKSIGGALFTKDGKTIVEYPYAKQDREYTIPDGVEFIGEYAFYSRYYLEIIHIPEGVKEIGVRAFSECDRIHTIEWPSTLEFIDEYAYADCTRLKNIYGYDSFYHIAHNAFENTYWLDNHPYGCIYIGSLLYSFRSSHTVPSYETTAEGVYRIGPYAFADQGPTELTISKDVIYIDPLAFHGAYNLKKIIVDEENPYYASVDGMLFDKEKKILISTAPGKDGRILIPEGTEVIYPEAFYGSHAYAVDVPESVYYIGEYAFRSCIMHELNLSEGVEYIGDNAFQNCSKLEKIVLPESIIHFGKDVLKGCAKLATITVPQNNVRFYLDDFLTTQWYRKVLPNRIAASNNNVLGFKGFVPEGTVLQIPENAVTIGMMAFADQEGISGVVFPETLKRIGPCAFENCPNLLEVTIPATVDEIYPFALGYSFVEGETEEDGEHFPVEGFLIRGYTNSAAEVYALENGFDFESIGVLSVSELLGDTDLDGKISIKDATAIQKYLVSVKAFGTQQKINADMNGDGAINIKDATAIQKYLVGLPY